MSIEAMDGNYIDGVVLDYSASTVIGVLCIEFVVEMGSPGALIAVGRLERINLTVGGRMFSTVGLVV